MIAQHKNIHFVKDLENLSDEIAKNKFWYIDEKQTDFLSLRTLKSEFT